MSTTNSITEELLSADIDRLQAVQAVLLAALRRCRSALNEVILAAGDLDHPTIRAHAYAAEQADAAIAIARCEHTALDAHEAAR